MKKKNKRLRSRKILYKGYHKTYDFTKFKTISGSGNSIKNGITTMYVANGDQNQFAKSIRESKYKTRSTNPNMNKKKKTQ